MDLNNKDHWSATKSTSSKKKKREKMKVSLHVLAVAVVTLFQMKMNMSSNFSGVHGAISIDNTVICSDIEVFQEFNYIGTAEVCARGSYSSPSPVQDESGAITYIGGYQNVYTIVKRLAVDEDEEVGIEIVIGRDDNDVCSGISVITYSGACTDPCISCTYCGNDSYSFDCSNLRYGRSTNDNCESVIPGMDLFFPFIYDVFAANNLTEPTVVTPPVPVIPPVPTSPISAPSIDNTVVCSDIEVFQECDYIVTDEVCARGSYSSPSPVQDESGTITYIGGYQNVYTNLKRLAADEDEEVGIEIFVGRDDNDVCSGVTVISYSGASADPCLSCTYCGNDSYSFDCSNVRYGRVVSNDNCESAIPGVDLFFPLTYDIFAVHQLAEPTVTPPVPVIPAPTPPISTPTSTTTTVRKIIRFFTGLAERILN